MPDRLVAVFFYGLFMDADLLRSKGIEPAHPRSALVEGLALRIGRRATLAVAAGARAHGVVMELSHEQIERLYSDPSLDAYRPEPVIARLDDGSVVAALCFNREAEDPGEVPVEVRADYASRLRAAATRAGLPPEYVEAIR